MTSTTQTIQTKTAQQRPQISPAEALTLLEETLSYFTPLAAVAAAPEVSAPEYVPYAA
ncbi:hypothetical protein [Pseudooceanicola spongiae]|uniref:hypothetical protein n=1 Tax=Pseudooceanicola spongiae TaxID=2613965 RepID=UPI001865C8DB|nr:hypothetical protein [Pseudooceanicola spongiae]|tara:strand:+ start:469 stop:642 length:174 start_codon:yes stop_codon:yes gene_type:complete